MSKVKVYEWRGVSSLSLSLVIDGKRKDVDFPQGTERPKTNARYECADEVVQGHIEATGLFKSGKIKIFREYEVASAVPEKVVTVVNAPAEVKKTVAAGKGVYSSVTTYQQAAAKLHEKFAVPMDQLQDPDSIMSEAAKNGATFPNLIS